MILFVDDNKVPDPSCGGRDGGVARRLLYRMVGPRQGDWL